MVCSFCTKEFNKHGGLKCKKVNGDARELVWSCEVVREGGNNRFAVINFFN